MSYFHPVYKPVLTGYDICIFLYRFRLHLDPIPAKRADDPVRREEAGDVQQQPGRLSSHHRPCARPG